MRTHSGDKRYQCRICDKTFIQIGTIKRHCETHEIPSGSVDDIIIKLDEHSKVLILIRLNHLNIFQPIPKPVERQSGNSSNKNKQSNSSIEMHSVAEKSSPADSSGNTSTVQSVSPTRSIDSRLQSPRLNPVRPLLNGHLLSQMTPNPYFRNVFAARSPILSNRMPIIPPFQIGRTAQQQITDYHILRALLTQRQTNFNWK